MEAQSIKSEILKQEKYISDLEQNLFRERQKLSELKTSILKLSSFLEEMREGDLWVIEQEGRFWLCSKEVSGFLKRRLTPDEIESLRCGISNGLIEEYGGCVR